MTDHGNRTEPIDRVSRCDSCTHPQSFHTNSCCSNAGCYCRRDFSQASSPTLIASDDDAQRKGE